MAPSPELIYEINNIPSSSFSFQFLSFRGKEAASEVKRTSDVKLEGQGGRTHNADAYVSSVMRAGDFFRSSKDL